MKFPPQQSLGVNQPIVANTFRIAIGADPFGSFLEASNITYEIQPYELIEGGRNHSPHLKPFNGPGKRGELALKWGSVKRAKLQSWVESVALGYTFRRNVFMFHMTRKGIPYRAYMLMNCWPKQWKGPDLNSSSTEIATEELTLIYESLVMVANPLA